MKNLMFLLICLSCCNTHSKRIYCYNTEIHFKGSEIDTLKLIGRPIIGDGTHHLYAGNIDNEHIVSIKEVDYFSIISIDSAIIK